MNNNSLNRQKIAVVVETRTSKVVRSRLIRNAFSVCQPIDDAQAVADEGLIRFKRLRVALVSMKPINTEFGHDSFAVYGTKHNIASINESCNMAEIQSSRLLDDVGGFMIHTLSCSCLIETKKYCGDTPGRVMSQMLPTFKWFPFFGNQSYASNMHTISFGPI